MATPAPFVGVYIKDPAGDFLGVVFGSIGIGIVIMLVFHYLIQPRYAFLVPPSEQTSTLGGRNNYSSSTATASKANFSTNRLVVTQNSGQPAFTNNSEIISDDRVASNSHYSGAGESHDYDHQQ